MLFLIYLQYGENRENLVLDGYFYKINFE